MDIKMLVAERRRQINEQQDLLIKTWAPYITAVNKYLQKHYKRDMTIHEARAAAQCLQNALDFACLRDTKTRLFEATTEDNIAFLGIQLPVIAALLPTLVLNELAIVQALDRRIGAVFYMDVMYGTTKGAITAGDKMIAARSGHDRTIAGRRYAMAGVTGEVVTGSAGAASGAVLTHPCAYKPGITSTSIAIKNGAGTTVATDSDGTLSGDGGSGTINYTTGVISFTLAADVDSDGLTVDYQYQYDLPYNATTGDYYGVPEANINITQENVTALDFPIRSKYSIGASIDLQKAHGINLEDEVVKYLGGEVRFGLASLAIAA